jgi:hypothetical protein
MAVLNTETDITTNIATSLIGQAVILVIMYGKTFKTDFIVFISIDVTLTYIFQY